MKIIGMKQSTQTDSMMRTVASQGTCSKGLNKKTLSMGNLKRKGGQIFTSNDGYTVKGMSGLPTKAFVDMLKKDNLNVDVKYADDIEGNEQISKTEEPLWSVKKENGNFNIKRNF